MKRFLGMTVLLCLLSGCAGAGKIPVPDASQGPATAPGAGQIARADGKEDGLMGQEDGNPSQGDTAPEGESPDTDTDYISIDYPFSRRFVYGSRNLFYIEDDGSLTCEYRSREGESIEMGQGDEDRYFFLVRDGAGEYTIYFLDRNHTLSCSPIALDGIENKFMNSAACLNGCFYFRMMDSATGDYETYYYDPEGDAFLVDENAPRLERLFENYNGKGLVRATNLGSNILELAIAGRIYMKDADNGKVYVFDEDGKEISAFTPSLKMDELYCYGPGYLIGRNDTDEAGKDIGRTRYFLYDAETGEEIRIPDEDLDHAPAGVEDGWVYFWKYRTTGGDTQGARDYYRYSIEDLKKGGAEPESVVTVDVYPEVGTEYYGYGRGYEIRDAFTVKPGRAYYLAYDSDGTEMERGDVVWRSVPVEGGEEQRCGVMERHEDFADWGYITIREEECREKEGEREYSYYAGKYENFHLWDDIKNSGSVNRLLDERYGSVLETGESMAEGAKHDVVDTDEMMWAREWNYPAYSYERTFGWATPVSDRYLQLAFNSYEYYGGAHGMGYTTHILFDMEEGSEVTFRDLYHGDEEGFIETALRCSMADWRDGSDFGYYDDYSPDLESDMENKFRENISMDMEMDFTREGVGIIYPAYTMGPYASGDLEIVIPYYMLDIDL